MDQAGLDEQSGCGVDQAVAEQDRRLDPGQHANEPVQPAVLAARPGSDAQDGEHRQDRGDRLEDGRSQRRGQRDRVPGLARPA
jgi:hypothetical protein